MRNLATHLLHVYPAPPPPRTQSPLLLLSTPVTTVSSPSSPPRRFSRTPLSGPSSSLWTQLLSLIESAAESLFHISIEDYNSHDLVASYTRPGQYLQLRVPDVEKPLFLAIASPPSFTASRGAFEFFFGEEYCWIYGGDSLWVEERETVELSAVIGLILLRSIPWF
ncbi:hypothetical protein F2Q69_00024616 [Brassica cretica]|uniref:FAD-binding FR-type domain-containing protein n=1 Tax=Brassica cretica TaxID=69181 RepID=A0A8S9QI22_BRACR|nr:hypothetical protein F2Q69_00024616 [Brassica cretica]